MKIQQLTERERQIITTAIAEFKLELTPYTKQELDSLGMKLTVDFAHIIVISVP